MADIAILVAEEYERRVKNSRKLGAEGADMEISLVSYVYGVAQGMKNKVIRQENVVKWVLEPKSQMGLAATDGFFSA